MSADAPSSSPPADRAGVRSRTFAALTDNPDYRRFYTGQGISLIGTWMQDATVGWIAYDITRSEWVSGVVQAAGVLPGLLVGLFAGALADRTPAKGMILVMQAIQMILAFLLGALVFSGSVAIWQMAFVLALTRVAVTFEMPSRQVFLYDVVGRSSLMNAIALNTGLFNASRVLGPALAGFCLARFGRSSPFFLNGVSYVAAIAALLSIRVKSTPAPRTTNGLSEVFGGFDYLRRDPRVRSLFLLMAYVGIVGIGYMALIPAFARLVVHTDEVGYSVLLACIGLGATVGALVVASLGGLRRKEDLVLGGMFALSLSQAAAGFIPSWAVLAWPEFRSAGMIAAVPCFLGLGFGGVVFYSATQTLIQTAVPDHLRGRIMGIWMVVFSGSVPLGSLWAGRLAETRGVPFVMELSAALCSVVALLVWSTGVLTRPCGVVDASRNQGSQITD